MKLCAHVGGARERLRDGSLTLDAGAQLQAAFERAIGPRHCASSLAVLVRRVGCPAPRSLANHGRRPPAGFAIRDPVTAETGRADVDAVRQHRERRKS